MGILEDNCALRTTGMTFGRCSVYGRGLDGPALAVVLESELDCTGVPARAVGGRLLRPRSYGSKLDIHQALARSLHANDAEEQGKFDGIPRSFLWYFRKQNKTHHGLFW
jgi:hypothetical protein